MKTLRDIRKESIIRMMQSGIESAAFDFDYILSECFRIDKTMQLSELGISLSEHQQQQLDTIINRYIAGEPLQYILGFTWFMDSKFSTDRNVLIPRNDTEVLCEYAIRTIKSKKRHVKVLDLCSGSGCIGISVLKACPEAELVMADISEHAVVLSEKNAAKIISGLHYQVVQSDLFAAIPHTQFDFIVSNPPYIACKTIDELEERVRDHEPRLALDGGLDGLGVYRRIIKEAPFHLSQDGMLLLEIGYDQADAITQLLEEGHFTNIELVKDYGGNYRVAAACRSSSSKTV